MFKYVFAGVKHANNKRLKGSLSRFGNYRFV